MRITPSDLAQLSRAILESREKRLAAVEALSVALDAVLVAEQAQDEMEKAVVHFQRLRAIVEGRSSL